MKSFDSYLGPHVADEIPQVPLRTRTGTVLAEITFRWAAGDPYALWMKCAPARKIGLSGERDGDWPPVEWVFAFDLLAAGVHTRVGDLDVTVEPDMFLPQTIVNVTLRSLDGKRATARLPRERVSRLVSQINAAMPVEDASPLYVEDIVGREGAA